MISSAAILSIGTLLIIKHYICDFPLQKPWHYLNKGKLWHPGGIDHAINHALGTQLAIFIGLLIFGLPINSIILFMAGLFDLVIHYFMDWFKVSHCQKMGYTPTNSEAYWIWLGIDQMVHYLTYMAILGGLIYVFQF